MDKKILLDIAYDTFVLTGEYLKMLSKEEWETAGIEGWMQVELGLALELRGIDVKIKGKQKRQCDLIIDGVGVELRAGTNAYAPHLLRALVDHPKSDLYLFLTKTNDKLMAELRAYFDEHNLVEQHRMLNPEWMVMVIEKESRW